MHLMWQWSGVYQLCWEKKTKTQETVWEVAADGPAKPEQAN